jgi:hypothetical protein
MRAILPTALILTLAACSGGTVAPPAAALSQPETPHARHAAPHDPVLGSVIGADADALIRQFGAPRLDIRDGDARKLQWSGTACVLDAYLYPAEKGGRATTTFVDARRGDGREVDRADCITAMRRN